MTRYIVWKENAGLRMGDDTYKTFRSVKSAAKEAVKLSRIRRLNDVVVGIGRNQERSLNKSESKKFSAEVRKLLKKTKTKKRR